MTDYSQSSLTQRIQAVLDAPADRLDKLVQVSGIDPTKDLRFGNFRGFDLRGADLRGYDFTGADLMGARFDGAFITDAKFSGAKFEDRAIERAADFAKQKALLSVTCFTPKGDKVTLPKGASAIDFAYKIHTELGNKTVGCKINGKFAPLSTTLFDGDEVELRKQVSFAKSSKSGELKFRWSTPEEMEKIRWEQECLRQRKLPENWRASDDEIAEKARDALYAS